MISKLTKYLILILIFIGIIIIIDRNVSKTMKTYCNIDRNNVSKIIILKEPEGIITEIDSKEDINFLLNLIDNLKFNNKYSLNSIIMNKRDYNVGPGAEFQISLFDSNNKQIFSFAYYKENNLFQCNNQVYKLKSNFYDVLNEFIKNL